MNILIYTYIHIYIASHLLKMTTGCNSRRYELLSIGNQLYGSQTYQVKLGTFFSKQPSYLF